MTNCRGKVLATSEVVQELQSRCRRLSGLKLTLQGIDSIAKVLNELPELKDLYYGLVIDNISCNEEMFTAVDEIGGQRLFHHIVFSDIVATKILHEITKKKLRGIFTFLPLNRLIPRAPITIKSMDAVPFLVSV